ncbi:unnamed protein product, partial [Didymodactylos carnosus]
ELPVVYDVQYHFKKWYNRQHPHTPECQVQKDDEDNLLDEYVFLGNKVPTTHLNGIKQADYMNCICKHRKHKNPGNTWSLQDAIRIILNQSLDKRYQLSKWSCGLDIRNSSYRQHQDFVPPAEVKSGMTQYASYDCFSVTRLQVAVKNNWSKLDIGEKFAHTWEKYVQSYTEQLIQDEQEQYQELMWSTVKMDDQFNNHYHQSPVQAKNSSAYDIGDYEPVSDQELEEQNSGVLTIEPSPSFLVFFQQQQESSAPEHNMVEKMQEENSRTVIVSNARHRTAQLSSTNKPGQLIQTTKFKPARTKKQQKRRNTKGSRKYRQKNYDICVMRQIDPRFTAPLCKEILAQMNIKLRKLKITNNMLHLGMYNIEQKQEVDHRLDPNTIFTTVHYGRLLQQQHPQANSY